MMHLFRIYSKNIRRAHTLNGEEYLLWKCSQLKSGLLNPQFFSINPPLAHVWTVVNPQFLSTVDV